jgi:hypothetical protein
MLRCVALAACLCIGSGCETGSGPSSDPGPLVDNASWVPSDMGEELFGAPPEGLECQLTPLECPEFPWPEGDCVTFEPGSTCIAAFVPECFDAYTVLAVYTRMPDDRVPLCNWLTLEQPSLRDIRVGDQIEVRTYHFKLTAPVAGEARMSLAIGDEIAFEERVLIPRDGQFLSNTWTAPKSYPARTPVLWHVDNHGTNEYLLIEVNVL